MAYPAGVTVVTLTLGTTLQADGEPGVFSGTVMPIFGGTVRSILWAAAGTAYTASDGAVASGPSGVAAVAVPDPHQAGWVVPIQGVGGVTEYAPITDWGYLVSGVIAFPSGRRVIRKATKIAPGQTTVDLDLVADGQVVGGVQGPYQGGGVEDVEVTTLTAGSDATAALADGVLTLGIPRGNPGVQGDPGPSGVVVLAEDDPDPDPPLAGVLYLRLGDPAPAVPSGLAASAITDDGFTLSWSASAGATGYEVRLNAGAGITATSPYALTGLTANTTYSAQVRARNAGGVWSAWATPLDVTTAEAPTGPTLIFADDFNRADGPAGNGWAAGGGGNVAIASNRLAMSGWAGYGPNAYQPNRPRNISVRAVFAGAIDAYQGIFLARHPSTDGGIKFFDNGGAWVIGNANGFASDNTAVTGAVPAGSTALRLDFDGVNVRAWAGVGTPSTLVMDTTLTALGLGPYVSSDPTDTYRVGYAGEAKTPYMDSFEIWTV